MEYLVVLKDFASNPQVIADFDTVLTSIEKMEDELNEIYLNKNKFNLEDEDVLAVRRARIQSAFEVADADFAGSLIVKIRDARVLTRKNVLKAFENNDSWRKFVLILIQMS